MCTHTYRNGDWRGIVTKLPLQPKLALPCISTYAVLIWKTSSLVIVVKTKSFSKIDFFVLGCEGEMMLFGADRWEMNTFFSLPALPEPCFRRRGIKKGPSPVRSDRNMWCRQGWRWCFPLGGARCWIFVTRSQLSLQQQSVEFKSMFLPLLGSTDQVLIAHDWGRAVPSQLRNSDNGAFRHLEHCGILQAHLNWSHRSYECPSCSVATQYPYRHVQTCEGQIVA